jgi:hypothetical protein
MPYMYLFDQKFGKAMAASWLCLAMCLPSFAAAPLFARFSPDRATIYAGEAFQVTLAIHITGETLAPQISIDALPAPDQLQLYPFQELPIEHVTLEGLPYEVRKFRAWARAPKAGSIAFSPRLNGTFIQTTRSFFMMQESRRPASIPVEALNLSIQSLPEIGRPPDFSGLVGRYSFSVSPIPLNIAPGDLITAVFTIEGDLLPDIYLKPGIKPLPELKVYELKAVAGETTPSRHVFNQTIVPVSSTLTAIPACSLSFFDTRKMQYITLTAGPFPIHYHAEHTPVHSVYSPTQNIAKAEKTNIISRSTPVNSPGIKDRIWRNLKNEKLVTTAGDAKIQAFLTPSESSKKLFTLKPGSSVIAGSTNDNWIFISAPEGMGWIPLSTISKSGPAASTPK